MVDTADPAIGASGAAGPNWLLVRRSRSDGKYAFYRAHAPGSVPLAELVRVAGSRWKVEEGFAGSKELAALDEHQVRTWTSWHRWTLLALLAHAFLSVTASMAAAEAASEADEKHLIPLTRNEIRRLFTSLLSRPLPAQFRLHWSRWRRHHQARAQAAHYRRQEALST